MLNRFGERGESRYWIPDNAGIFKDGENEGFVERE